MCLEDPLKCLKKVFMSFTAAQIADAGNNRVIIGDVKRGFLLFFIKIEIKFGEIDGIGDDLEFLCGYAQYFREFFFCNFCLDNIFRDKGSSPSIEDTKEFPLEELPALTANNFSDAEKSTEYSTKQVGMDEIGYKNFWLKFSHDFSEAENNAEIERRPKLEI